MKGNCSAVIQKILPPKHKDPGSLTIPCSRGEAEEISVEGPMSKKRKLPTFNAKVPKCPRVKHNAQRAEGLIQKTSVEHALVKST